VKTLAVVERSLVRGVADSIGKTLLDSPRADLSRFVDRKKADLEVLAAIGWALEDPVNCLLYCLYSRITCVLSQPARN
jgi:hypothetical protein